MWPIEVDAPLSLDFVHVRCNGPIASRDGTRHVFETNLFPYNKCYLFEKGVEQVVEKKASTKIVKLKMLKGWENLELRAM